MVRFLLPIACCFLLASTLGAATKPAPPNILLIQADDLGINDLGCYGRKDHRTPHLDRLAMQGMRFTCAYCAQPICSPSRAALLTGKAPARLHLTTYLPGRTDTRSQKVLHPRIRLQLPREEESLASRLKKAGYVTACIGKWHLGEPAGGPKSFGFDVYQPGRGQTKPSAKEGGKGEFDLTAKAEEFITANKANPFFVYLNHHNPHIPLAVQPERLAKHRDAFNPLYAAVVETLDDAVGRVLARLTALGLDKDTLVVFVSDNGGLHVPELKDDAPTHNTPFRAGKGFLYEGGLRVPLIVRWPGKIRAGVTTDMPVSNMDFLPTLLAMAGIDVPAGLDGVSFAPLLLGTGKLSARPIYWHFPHYNNQGGRPGGAIRDGKWKFLEYYDGGKAELFDLEADPGEAKDLASSQTERVEAMRASLAAWRKKVGAQENRPNPDFDETLYRKLYLDTDVSNLRPARTAEETSRGLREWRKTMDAVTRSK